jgi:hypothetical protein
MTTSNQLLSPYTVMLRLRKSKKLFYMYHVGPKMCALLFLFAKNLIEFIHVPPSFDQN